MKRIITLFVLLASAFSLFAQEKFEVKGVVVDALGPVIGATVIESGTTNGVSTGIDGEYTIKVASAGTQVEISCMGYSSQIFRADEVPATVTLKEDSVFLEEAVAIGYGSQKKKEVTGSVASIKAEDFNAGVKTSPIGLLQGKVAGLNISRSTSDPTSTGFNVQIRGFSTLDKGVGTSPLYIVDGVPVSNIDNISPDEIASMDVLKDGSAAAIYGTRGTNGVIIITTKRGDNFSDKAVTRVEYSGYASVSMRNGKTGMATPEEFVKLSEISGGKITPTILTDKDGNPNMTDWMSEITRKAAFTHNHNLAVTGSSSKFNYRASVNYKDAQGIARNNARNEVIAKIAASQKALKGWLDLNYDFSYMHYRNDYFCGDFKQAATLNPTFPIYDSTSPNGYYTPQGTGVSNPVENMNQKEAYQTGNYFRGSLKATLNILPVEGLKINAFAAFEEGDNAKYWAHKQITTNVDESGKAGRDTDRNFSKLFEITADYAHSFGRHNVAAVAGFSYQNFLYDGMSVENKGFPTESMKYYQIGNGDPNKTYLKASSYRNSNTLAALFARANYNYAEKYLVSASIRREGSSRFGANNKWGWFPAVSLGWRITGEDFMENAKGVNDLKLRLGFGVTGNNLGSDLRSVATLTKGGTFLYNGKYENTYTIGQNVNPDLRWEKKYEYNFGLDFAFLDNRLYGSFDAYFRNTRDLLWDYEVPTPPYQYHTLLANAGRMNSYGVELVISGVPVKTKDWTWTTTPTISWNHNVITRLSDPSKGFNYKEKTSGDVNEPGINNTGTQILIEGQSVGAFYGYKFLGIKDGTWYYSTPAGGVVDGAGASDGYRQVIGNAQPWLTFGWNNSVRYKNFDLSIFLRGVVGNKILNLTRWAYGPRAMAADNIFMKDVKLKDGVVYANKEQFSDYYLENGSYMKIDNITLGYNFKFKESSLVDRLRIYITGQNLATITGYSGQDPEVNTTSVQSPGIDYCDFYPTVATVLFGLNISFK